MSFWENIFSVKKELYNTHKTIRLLGIKFKYFSVKDDLYNQIYKINKNRLQILCNILKISDNEELFALRGCNILFIIHKNCLLLDYKFLQDYVIISGYANKTFELIKLEKDSILYKDHITRVQNGEFLWKYVDRYYYIGHSFISKEVSTGNIYINSSYVQEENMLESQNKIRHIPLVSKRKYIPGITVGDYIENKSYKEKLVIIDKLLNYIFTVYKDETDAQRVSGNLLDCHLCNFLIGKDGKFHFVDFDLISTESLERGYCIYFMLYRYDTKLYKRMLKRYGLKDKHSYYEKHFSVYKQPHNTKIRMTKEHIELRKKYFTDEGLYTQYQITYKKVKTF